MTVLTLVDLGARDPRGSGFFLSNPEEFVAAPVTPDRDRWGQGEKCVNKAKQKKKNITA